MLSGTASSTNLCGVVDAGMASSLRFMAYMVRALATDMMSRSRSVRDICVTVLPDR